MARPIRLNRDQPLFDIGSHGRAGPGQRLSLAQIEQIRRTVTRTPEVMVKGIERQRIEYQPRSERSLRLHQPAGRA